MKKGTVLHHTNLLYKDGEIGNKLLIVLNNQCNTDPYLCCKTTSKKRYGIDTEGCYYKNNIFLTTKKPFDSKTWVQFDPNSLFEFSAPELISCGFKKELKIIGCLTECDINEIVNCIKMSEDISEYHLELLKKKTISTN